MKKEVVDTLSDVAGAATGSVVGAGIGTMVAGPIGAVGGAVAGSVVEKLFAWAGNEIKERFLSKQEEKRIADVMYLAKEKINNNFQSNKQLREDSFFDGVDVKSSAEEILEGTLLSAQREYEERKIKYIANLYANIAFDDSISREMADRLLKISSELTYRQLIILSIIGFLQISGVPCKKDAYKSVAGLVEVSIASDIYDLYRKSLVFSSEVILDAGGINPSKLSLGGYGALLYNLMELPKFPLIEEGALDILKFMGAVIPMK